MKFWDWAYHVSLLNYVTALVLATRTDTMPILFILWAILAFAITILCSHRRIVAADKEAQRMERERRHLRYTAILERLSQLKP